MTVKATSGLTTADWLVSTSPDPGSDNRAALGNEGDAKPKPGRGRATRGLDPRTKLVLVVAATVFLGLNTSLWVEGLWIAFIALLFVFAPGDNQKRRVFAPIIAGTWLVLLAADVLVMPLLNGGVAMFLSFFAIGLRSFMPSMAMGAYLILTTAPSQFLAALRALHLPEKAMISVAVVLRFFPTLAYDVRRVREGLRLRAADEGFHPARAYERFLVPILMSADRAAGDLTIAALVRGVELPGRKTSMTPLGFGLADLFALLLAGAFLIEVVALPGLSL
ncbi:MAG: energy-coupling factor transporter transmembrane component T [Actinomycetaceae bacterium]|nr:energy-coupling factor transporter transmembrane component T [Actinomycetaceae bacterium]